MSYIETIKNKNPIIFNIFKNAYENNKLSHAYLFSAPKEILIKNESLFLIELLISPDPFKGKIRKIVSYPDLQIIDNNKQIIKKDQVITAINNLQETAIERNGKKILMINNLEFANSQSLNSLLKFLEEPTPETYLIFTTNNLSKILKTIKSRVQIINVKTISKKEITKIFLNDGIDEENANLLSDFTSNLEIARQWNNDDFEKIKRHILNILEKALFKKEIIYTGLFSILKVDNAVLILNLINSFFNDIWKQKYGLETSFNQNNLINNYIDIKFDYKKALKITINFIKNIHFNINFNLYKNKFLLKIKRLYK